VSSQISTLTNNLAFSSALLSCRMREGDFRFVAEGECSWMTFSQSSLHQAASGDNFGFKLSGVTIAGGFQKAIGDRWHLGFGLSYDGTQSDVDRRGLTAGNDSSSGDQFEGGAVVKGNFGESTASLALTLGHRSDFSQRAVDVGGSLGTAVSHPDLDFYALHLRFAHAFENGAWYVRPILDTGYTDVHHSSFTETGAGVADLQTTRGNQRFVTLQTLVELGREFAMNNGALVRLFGRAGGTWLLSDSMPDISASFVSAPDGVAPFSVSGQVDRNWRDVTAGVDLFSKNGSMLRASFTHHWSDNSTAREYALKYSYPLN
jgi:outer membrane autotransporter protein